MAQRDVGNLRTRLSWEDSGAKRSLTGFRDDLRGLRSEMNRAKSQGREYSNSLKGLRQQSDVLNRTYKTQQQRVRELRRRYEESRREKGEDAKQTRNLQRQYNNATAQMNRTEQQLKEVTTAIENQVNPWKRLGRNMDTAGQRMQTFGRGMSSMGRTMTMGVTTPILAMGGAALKVAMDFEEGMSQVQAVSGATASEMENLEEQAKEMGSTTRFSATEAASGQEFLARAGFEANQIISAMPGLLDLAASANMDLGRASDIASNIISGFSMEAEEAGRVSDVLAKGSATANTNVEQLGNAMQYVAPVANTLNVSFEDVTAAVGHMSDAGIQGQKAGRQLRQGMLRLASPTGEAASLIEELGIQVFDAEGNMKSMPGVVAELNDGLKGMESDARAAALATIFGSESTSGWSALLDRGADELKDYSGELKNAEGAAEEMAETMEDNAKGSMREFRSAMESAGIEASEHLLPAFTDLVEEATGLIRKFGELDDETQKNIIKMLGLAAAIGPAAVVAGNLTTAIGGIVRVGGGLAGLLGKAGGSGLLGRIAGLSRGGVVGLAIGGVAALGSGIYALTKASGENLDETLKSIEARRDEIDETEDLIDRYEELQNKNKLSTDEVLRYMDIMDELKNAKSEETIKKLTDEQEELLKKSGLTNDEMDEFLGLNDKVVEKTPETAKAISEQGNAYAEVLDEVKELNEAERQRLTDETYMDLTQEMSKQRDNLQEQKELKEEIKGLESDQKESLETQRELTDKIRDYDSEIAGLKEDMLDASDEEIPKLEEKIGLAAEEKRQAELKLMDEQDSYDNLIDQIEGKKDSLEETEKELEKFEQLKDDYAAMVLYEQGIVAEKGKAVETLQEEQKEIDKAREKLDKKLDQEKITPQEYRKANDRLDDQQTKIDTARGKLEEMNTVAGRTIYKDMKIETDPTVSALNSMLGDPVEKHVALNVTGNAFAEYGLNYRGYATGTDHHPGGAFIAGEEGFELGRMGNRWEMLNAGLYDRPSGYQVFTHDESKKIISALNNMPGYADGARPSGEIDRVVNQMENRQEVQEPSIVIEKMEVRDETDVQSVARELYNLKRNASRRRGIS